VPAVAVATLSLTGSRALHSLVPSADAASVRSGIAISSGGGDTCALLSGGVVDCWGINSEGQLGNGTRVNSSRPVRVKGITTARAIGTASYVDSCALLRGGTVKCWGANAFGVLGNPAHADFTTPVTVKGIRNAIAISVGFWHTCALLRSRTVKCWGADNYGQLGNGKTEVESPTPVAVRGITSATAISTSQFSSCALISGGTIKCWGSTGHGQAGVANNLKPVAVQGISGASAVSLGWGYACAVISGGVVKCWGNGMDGQLGNRSDASSATPVTVTGIGPAVAVSSGFESTCALLTSGSINCWGNNFEGQLGNGTTGVIDFTPVAVTGIRTAKMVSTSSNILTTTCAVLSSGSADCWGNNGDGQIGNGTTRNSSTPVAVKGIGP